MTRLNDVRTVAGLWLFAVWLHAYLSVGFDQLFAGGWRVAEVYLLILATTFAVTVWLSAHRFCEDDYKVYWMPFCAWLLAAMLAKFGVAPYPRENSHAKGLFNLLVIEPALVGCLTSLYGVRFVGHALQNSARARATIRAAIVVFCVVMTWLVPPLAD